MNKKIKTLLIVAVVMLLIGGGFLFFRNLQIRQKTKVENEEKFETGYLDEKVESKQDKVKDAVSPDYLETDFPILSDDKKSVISSDGEVVLSVDDDAMFEGFNKSTRWCNEIPDVNEVGRKIFCKNRDEFGKQTEFEAIFVSPDEEEIGFTLVDKTSDDWDSVVGVFSLSSNTVTLLTDYWLDNEFKGFSTEGTYFLYQENCWEAECRLIVMDSKTLEHKGVIYNRSATGGSWILKSIQWISDNEIELTWKEMGGDTIKTEKRLFG